ncbi:hypothetical protein BRARA_F02098 [Brassica rapa]|uniref:Uncharacterized protein n=2 Tax=Brassica campestris TaxID=3711 RepID=A0A397Z031_BRACM|nr:hypothetical protein IGI04_023636 [Brassica rapa subsp. trilocularis]RID58831.1 hypothetical protein BRARA_F02098 [Brassica rapa]
MGLGSSIRINICHRKISSLCLNSNRFGRHDARRGVAVTSSLHHLKAKRGTHIERFISSS